jgi:hypothetical protein
VGVLLTWCAEGPPDHDPRRLRPRLAIQVAS